MKRFVLFLIAFSLFLCANAQIRSSFYGCKLGVTTKGQLLDNLKQLGHKCLYDKKIKCYYIENVTFAGKQWDSCQFKFYKDTLFSVGFGIKSYKEEVIDIYNQNRKLCYFDDGITILSTDYKIEKGNFATLIYQSKKLIIQEGEDEYNDI